MLYFNKNQMAHVQPSQRGGKKNIMMSFDKGLFFPSIYFAISVQTVNIVHGDHPTHADIVSLPQTLQELEARANLSFHIQASIFFLSAQLCVFISGRGIHLQIPHMHLLHFQM